MQSDLYSMLLYLFASFIRFIVDMREEPSPILSWKYAVDKVPWGVIFLLGSGFCIAKAATVTITLITP